MPTVFQNCYECGLPGHKALECKNRRVLANKKWECGCNHQQLKRLDFNGPTKTHCCECGKIVRPTKMEWHLSQIGRMRCLKCKYENNQEDQNEPQFGICVNCGKTPTSSIQSVLDNGLCRKCNEQKENTERYGSATTIRECWTCGTIT